VPLVRDVRRFEGKLVDLLVLGARRDRGDGGGRGGARNLGLSGDRRRRRVHDRGFFETQRAALSAWENLLAAEGAGCHSEDLSADGGPFGRPRGKSLRFGRRDVLDDEDLLARFDEAQVAPGDFFDGAGILAEAACLFAQTRVLGALAGHGGGDRVVLPACTHHGQQPAVADESVDDDDRRQQQQQDVNEPSPTLGPFRDGLPALRRGFVFEFDHAQKLYNRVKASTRDKMPIRMSETQVVFVWTTAPDDARASSWARTLVEERLVACVNVHGPMTSVYRWDGVVEQAVERQLVMKTARDRVPALHARLRSLHPYELPEFVVVAVEGGSEAYLDWVIRETRAEPASS